jgi:chromosomal replication initiation ATPase DnaA
MRAEAFQESGNARRRYRARRARAARLADRMECCRVAEALTASTFGVKLADMRSAGRGSAAEALARQAAMYLAHVHLGIRLSEVARHFRRDRTTVAHACARIEERRDDPKFERILDCLEAALERWDERFRPAGPA